MRLIQLAGPGGRRVGVVEDGEIQLLRTHESGWALAQAGLQVDLSGERLDYDEINAGASQWKVVPAVDHPEEPARCLVSGTGLSHIRSATNRQAMHAAAPAILSPAKADERMTDSMRMYQ